ncbi:MAG: class I SAM-dependent rRNA methyltransferase [Gemmatimonadetes bacterium]|nr:class I SAM-dependent rRNA methyltransferase [Gemmatimonadota bacterium]
MEKIIVSPRGARRWRRGHPWIYRSDVERSDAAPGVVRAEDTHGNFLGQALWSPPSEISLRFLTSQEAPVDGDWWHDRMAEALAVRDPENLDATGYRIVHAEGDSLPSLIVDKYGEIVVVQLLSAGLEAVRGQVLAAIDTVVNPKSILLRNDASVRRHEDLPLEVEEIRGPIPEFVEVREGAVRYLVAPHTGQKTGSFLDQRENRVLMAGVAHGRALDLFTYQGLFALQMARRAESVVAVDSSAAALEVAAKNAELNGLDNLEWVEANVFDLLREYEREGRQFDTIVLDPPAFARQRSAIDRALRGYKEINLRAMRILAPKGTIFSASCSFHIGRDRFFEMLISAASDSGRRLVLQAIIGQSRDHPSILTVPETGYLKAALLRAVD